MGTRILAGFLSSSLQPITPVSPLQPCSHCLPSMSPKANHTTSTPTSPTTQYLEPTRNVPQTGESSHLLLEHLTRTHILATTALNAICTECWNMDVSEVKHLSPVRSEAIPRRQEEDSHFSFTFVHLVSLLPEHLPY